MMSAPYPLTFEPILFPKVWGGRALERLGKTLPAQTAIGESWEIADLDATSHAGAGGDAVRSVITNGPLQGSTLRQAMDAWGEGLLGSASPSPQGGFPALVKFLDAREPLSVQVHPSPAYAQAHPDALLKTESWYVVAAEPGAVIYVGLAPGVGRDELSRAIEHELVPDVLATVPARVGDCLTLPSGTVHALGAGVVVAEVQTPSDTTFRLYDWTRELGRARREMHVLQALDCALYEPPPAPMRRPADEPVACVAQTPSYAMHALNLAPRARWSASAGALVVMNVGTAPATIEAAGTSQSLSAGGTALIPAACAHDVLFEGQTDLLVIELL